MRLEDEVKRFFSVRILKMAVDRRVHKSKADFIKTESR